MIPAGPGALRLHVAGEAVDLLPERALWWPRERTLCVADVHLGKAASFRALGMPVPSGTTQHNLERLDALVRRLSPARLLVLGDLLHAAAAQQTRVMAAVLGWRQAHADLQCLLVRGNHDMHAGDPPAALRITTVDEPYLMAPFAACHHPQVVPGLFVLAGHLHPATRLHGRGHEHHRLPCFCQTDELLILPAFGAFTGSTTRGQPAGARCFAVGAGSVWALP